MALEEIEKVSKTLAALIQNISTRHASRLPRLVTSPTP